MGQKFASYNTTGIVTGFYDSVDSPAPTGVTAIAITDTQWQDALSCPYPPITVENGVLVIPTLPTLAQAQAAQVATLRTAYGNANATSISFTDSAGVTDTYQCDDVSVQNLNRCISGFRSGTVPSGFYWRSATNRNNSFTYADLEALGLEIANRGFANFEKMQTLLTQVESATTVSAVNTIIW
ncbi:MAG: DUF4376 domain-containing protein [Nitrospirota bacterium]|nr:DUF4376 domain-containing protein [Nitrospirota bacterium]